MTEIQQLEQDICERIGRLNVLRKAAPPTPVRNYSFTTLDGTVSLLQLFGDKTVLFAIHSMGTTCPYCTLWADGLNPLLPHLESKYAVVLLSKDPPETQRSFANARGWRFRTASHRGGDYIRDQSVCEGESNMPGMVCYQRDGDEIFKMNATPFGPGDQFSPIWHVLSLAGHGEDDWSPQFSYWRSPKKLEDGGLNILQ
jgi:predicted dithiol-disulfide oxidoreductase (DUF899 family)